MGFGGRLKVSLWTMLLMICCIQQKASSTERVSGKVNIIPPLSTTPVITSFNSAHNGRVCSTWGHFHFKTFDGDIFHFPGLCNYVFSSHCNTAYEDFNVQIRRTVGDNTTTISYVTMRLDGVDFEMEENAILVNSERIQMPYSGSGFTIEKIVNTVKVTAKLGLTLLWNEKDSLMLELDEKYVNQTCGLCGDFNGIPTYNEFFSNGVAITPLQFGIMQKLNGPTEDCEDPLPSPQNNCTDEYDVCKEILTGSAFYECNALVWVDDYIETCVHDLCQCADSDSLSCLCNTFAEYSRQCAHAGGQPQNWRTPELCPTQCPFNMEYQECGSPCADTCTNAKRSQLCEDHCMDGCFCPPGTVYDDISGSGCIPLQQCPCIYNSKTYAPGTTYSQHCRSCSCTGGQWNCTDLLCPGICSVEGGSHISTYDEKHYDVHGDCTYVLSKVCDENSFTVLGELRRCGLTETETCLKMIALDINGGETSVVIKSNGDVFLNWIYTQLPISAANVTIFRPSSFFIVMETKIGFQLVIQLVPVMQLYLHLDPSFKDRTCGLCGNFNNRQIDDFKAISGVVEGTAPAFANTWKTQAACPNIKHNFEDPCTLSIENEKYANHWCGLLTDSEGPFAECHSAVNSASYHKNCMFDTCNCERSEECMCAALSSYVRACAAKGVELPGWRATVCSKYTTSCPQTLSYSYSISSCQPTCRSLSELDVTCSVKFVPVDGCTCEHDTYMDDSGKCVPADQCPCYYKGTPIRSGEVLHDLGVACTCSQGKLNCIGGGNSKQVCTSPMVYFDCANATADSTGAECQKSCQTLDMHCYNTQCVSGCMCPSGLVSDGKGGCIPIEECPCIHNDASYKPGEKIQIDCNTCVCKNRMWKCTTNKCLGTCAIYGDGHYITFDDKRYNFNGNCEYVLLQDHCGKNSSSELPFQIISENIPCGTTGTTCTKSIKVFVGSYELVLSEEHHELIQRGDGGPQPYRIRYMGIYIVIETVSGLIILWDKETSIFIKLSADFRDQVCGLCGNYDGNGINDFTTRTQSIVGDVLEFGNSWKVSPSCPDAKNVKDPCTKNPYRKSWSQKQCSIINSKVFATCHSQVDPTKYYEACVTDSCACDTGGDCECFCTAVAAYAQVCSEYGVCISWRSPSVCPLFCDYYNTEGECDWHYKPCGAPCMKTCRNPSGRCLYQLPGLEGCYPYCPGDKPYFSEDEMKCVDVCGCYDSQGNYHLPGTTFYSRETCQSCQCTRKGIECSYHAEACYCYYEGNTYIYGDVVYNTTDGLGWCLIATCDAEGIISRKHHECVKPTPTTPFTFTTVSATTTRGAESTTPSTTTCVHRACEWTEWYDVSYPEFGQNNGDYETLNNIRKRGHNVCKLPDDVECRAQSYPNEKLEDLGQNIKCTKTDGLLCNNKDQNPPICYNYEMRLLCCEYTPCNIPTSISYITNTKGTTPVSEQRTTITKPDITKSETSKETTILPTLSKGTATQTTGEKRSSSTPSVTPLKSSTITATSLKSTSLSKPTGVIPTMGKTTSLPLTTSSTPVPNVSSTSGSTSTTCQPICQWSDWFDNHYPSSDLKDGDVETLEAILSKGGKVCETPQDIECRAEDYPDVSMDLLGQKVKCNLQDGLLCKNAEQNAKYRLCYNYQMRLKCCDNSHCIPTTTAPSSTTATTTTVAGSTPRQSTPPGTSQGSTTPPPVPGTTTARTTPVLSTTPGVPGSTITPSVTPVKSSTITATSVKSTSLSKPTGVIPTTGETTRHPLTTSSTLTALVSSAPGSTNTICQPRCQWTDWFDNHYPSSDPNDGDLETLEIILSDGGDVCENPKDIECRAEEYPDVRIDLLGQKVQCSIRYGLKCHNFEQTGETKICLNFQIRFQCCNSLHCNPATSTPGSTNTATLTVAGSTPGQFTPPGTSQGSTTPPPVPSTTTAHTTLVLSTTSGIPGSTSTPSVTLVKSSTITATSLRSTSVSNPTGVVPTMGKTTSLPLTTSSTPVPNVSSTSGSTSTTCQPICQWSDWFDNHYPSSDLKDGDVETLEAILSKGGKVCETPQDIECRAEDYPDVSIGLLGQKVKCNLQDGLLCKNVEQNAKYRLCYNYQMRLKCCDNSHCITTTAAPGSTTAATTTVAGSTPRQSTPPETSQGSTTLPPVPGTTTAHTTLALSTTPGVPGPTSTPSVTLVKSSTVTATSLKSTSLSKPTGVIPGTGETTGVPLTTASTLVPTTATPGSTTPATTTIAGSTLGQSTPPGTSQGSTTLPPVPSTTTAHTTLVLSTTSGIPGSTSTPSVTLVKSSTITATSLRSTSVSNPTGVVPTMGKTTSLPLTTSSTPVPNVSSTSGSTSTTCQPICQWSDWFDNHYPSSDLKDGDVETLEAILSKGGKVCETPQDIECRAEDYPDISIGLLGQKVKCNLQDGLLCKNVEQNAKYRLCYNYQMRLKCCDNSHCFTTTAAPGSTTAATTTVASSTPRQSTPPETSQGSTTLPPVPGSTTAHTTLALSTTPGVPGPTSTPSVTLVKSSTVTATSLKSTSLSKPTGVIPGTGETTGVPLTTASTLVPTTATPGSTTPATTTIAGSTLGQSTPPGTSQGSTTLPPVPSTTTAHTTLVLSTTSGIPGSTSTPSVTLVKSSTITATSLRSTSVSNPTGVVPTMGKTTSLPLTTSSTPVPNVSSTSGSTSTTCQPICQWSDWFDNHYPSSDLKDGDVETLEAILSKGGKVCETPQDIECRAEDYPDISIGLLGQKVKCNLQDGLLCKNVEQNAKYRLCYNYQMRLKCCDNSHCFTTTAAPGSTTAATTTVAGSTPRQSTPPETSQGSTTPPPVPGTTTAHTTLALSTTPGVPGPTSTPSVTLVKSSTVTATSLKSTSLSKPTGVIPGTGETTGVPLTTASTLVPTTATPGSTTPATTTIAGSTLGQSTPPGTSQGSTTLPPVPSTTTAHTTLVLSTTSGIPGSTSTPSVTLVKSSTITATSLRSTSVSNPTGVVPTMGKTTSLPLTTSSTPVPNVSSTSGSTSTTCQPICQWSDWFDNHYPSSDLKDGDVETLEAILSKGGKVCETPQDIECRAEDYPDISIGLLGQKVKCNLQDGLLCKNVEQNAKYRLCYNYQMRLKCCDNSHCFTTTAAPGSTTAATTTVTGSTPRQSTPPETSQGSTTTPPVPGTTTAHTTVALSTTPGVPGPTSTPSVTLVKSSTVTATSLKSTSLSKPTGVIPGTGETTGVPLTTASTLVPTTATPGSTTPATTTVAGSTPRQSTPPGTSQGSTTLPSVPSTTTAHTTPVLSTTSGVPISTSTPSVTPVKSSTVTATSVKSTSLSKPTGVIPTLRETTSLPLTTASTLVPITAFPGKTTAASTTVSGSTLEQSTLPGTSQGSTTPPPVPGTTSARTAPVISTTSGIPGSTSTPSVTLVKSSTITATSLRSTSVSNPTGVVPTMGKTTSLPLTTSSTPVPNVSSTSGSTSTTCQPICQWSDWFDNHYPSSDLKDGDVETLEAILSKGGKVCETPQDIECRAEDYPDISIGLLGQKVKCNLQDGLLCKNVEQNAKYRLCYNYQMRLKCCDNSHCFTTTAAPGSTTAATTTVAGSTPRQSTPPETSQGSTTPPPVPGTTTAHTTLALSTTPGVPGPTSTPSVTLVKSSTVTATSLKSTSLSKPTGVIPGTGETTGVPLTTASTLVPTTATPGSTTPASTTVSGSTLEQSTLPGTSQGSTTPPPVPGTTSARTAPVISTTSGIPGSTSTPSVTLVKSSTITATSLRSTSVSNPTGVVPTMGKTTSLPLITSSIPVPNVSSTSGSTSTTCQPICQWSDWFDNHYPSSDLKDGDVETLEAILSKGGKVCETPQDIECRAEDYPDVSIGLLGQKVKCNLQDGLLCKNVEQNAKYRLCYNYQMRLKCCDNSHCFTTTAAPGSTTAATTTVAGSTPRQSTPPETSQGSTTPPPVPGTTTAHTTLALSTTPGVPGPTSTPSVTLVKSSTVTATSLKSTSLSKPTGVIPGTGETTGVPLTTASTLVPTTATPGSTTPATTTVAGSTPRQSTPPGTSQGSTTLPSVPSTTTAHTTPVLSTTSGVSVSTSTPSVTLIKSSTVTATSVKSTSLSKPTGVIPTLRETTSLLLTTPSTLAPITASPGSTTVATTTVSGSTPGQSTPPGTSQGSTTPPPVPGTPTAHTTPAFSTTPGIPGPTSTPSVTLVKSSTVTATSLKSTSLSKPTGVIPTTGETTGLPLTTASTLVPTTATPGLTTAATTTVAGSTSGQSTPLRTSQGSTTLPPVPSTTTAHTTPVLSTTSGVPGSTSSPSITPLKGSTVTATSLKSSTTVSNSPSSPIVSSSPFASSIPVGTWSEPSLTSAFSTVSSSSIRSTEGITTVTSHRTTPCFCHVSGITESLYSPGEIIYNRTDSAGCSFYAVCNKNCEVERYQGPCPSTTSSHPPTSLVPSTATPPASKPIIIVPSTEIHTTTRVPTAPVISGCLDIDPPRKINETWMINNCTQATCEGDNKIVLVLPPPPEKIKCASGLQPIKIEDKDGCVHYECDCICTGWDNFNYQTFDGTYYTFYDNCTYVLVQEVVNRHGKFSVLVDNYFCDVVNDRDCSRSLIVNYNYMEVVLHSQVHAGKRINKVFFNNEPVYGDFSKDGIIVTTASPIMTVEIPAINALIGFNGIMFSIKLPYGLFEHNTEGQCGTCTNDQSDDCRLPSGHEAASCSDMGAAWVVYDEDKPHCQVVPTLQPPVSPTPKPLTSPTPTICSIPAPLCELIVSDIFVDCHKVLPPKVFYEDCLLEACHSSNDSLDCHYVELYASLCATKSVCTDWRSKTQGKCPYYCPKDKVYNPCGPVHPATCEDGPNSDVSHEVAEGCFCSEDNILFNSYTNICVPECGCVGPDGLPKMPGSKWKSNCQECLCDPLTVSVQCKPQTCNASETPVCEKDGFVPVSVLTLEDPCCPQVQCQCNISACTNKEKSCEAGYHLAAVHFEGDCCISFVCEPIPNICVVNETVYTPGMVIPSESCETCICSNTTDPVSKRNDVQCTAITCDTTCPAGYEYEKHTGECCGKCVQVACINNLNGTTEVIKPGDIRQSKDNNCSQYECEEIENTFVLVQLIRKCPYIECPLDEMEMSSDGCCKQCTSEPKDCKVHKNQTLLSENDCVSSEVVEMTYCEGTCPSSSLYSNEAKAMQHRCTCCQELKSHRREVTLTCADGSSINYDYIYVDECQCMTACIPEATTT